VIGVANDRVKILFYVFWMWPKSAKSLSAALSVGETLELSIVAVSFWLPGLRLLWSSHTEYVETVCVETL